MNYLLELHKTKKYIITTVVTFVAFMFIYYMLDASGNESYKVMIEQYGLFIVLVHIVLNILISFISAVVFTWGTISLTINKKDVYSSNIPIVGVVLGFLTFGCTPCVVSMLSIFGITFVPMVLPNGNLIWKFVVLAIVLFSAYITYRSANKGCKV